MHSLEVCIAPQNSIVFVSDTTRPCEIPLDRIGYAPIVATPSCIVVTTLPEMDGDTTIRLGDSFASPEGQLAFDAMLETPGMTVSVSGVTEDLLSMRVPNQLTNIKIWVNREEEPDLITIQAQ